MESATVEVVGGLLGIIVASGTIITFWMNFATKIANNKADAKAAMEIAQEAKKDAHEATEKVVLLSASFGLYREQIAREYIHREVMREVEDRLTAAINRLGDRFDRVLGEKRQGSH